MRRSNCSTARSSAPTASATSSTASPLVDNGLNHAHFGAVTPHLQATLEELGVPANLVNDVMTVAASTKDDILNR